MMQPDDREINEVSSNPDPITGEPGAHPVGTGIGAAATGAAATAIGATAGPIGAIVGAVVGSVIGGLVGKSAAEATNPTIPTDWQEADSPEYHLSHSKRDRPYQAYELAYQIGYEGFLARSDQLTTYREVEPELRREYEQSNDGTSVDWDEAKYAVEDAWQRARRNHFFYQEDLYWHEHYDLQPYYNPDLPYSVYQPAYRLGYEAYVEHGDRQLHYHEVEWDLRRQYEAGNPDTELRWDEAKYAVHDAWNRAEQTFRF